MSGCRITRKGETTTATTPSSAHPIAEMTGSWTSEEGIGVVTESTNFERFLKTTTIESEHSKRYTENVVESGEQSPASEIEDFYSALNFTDYNETDVFNVSTATGGGSSRHGGGMQFKHDIMPFENDLENSTEFRVDVEEMFQKLDNRRPIREIEIENTQRLPRSEQLTPILRRRTHETLLVRCHNAGTFFSARERWWYIAVSNCGSDKGLDLSYRFKMTNGAPGDFWSEHFSADEMRTSHDFAPETIFNCFVFCFSNSNLFCCSDSADTTDRSDCVLSPLDCTVLLHD